MTAHARELVDFSQAPPEATHWCMVNGKNDVTAFWVDVLHKPEGYFYPHPEALADAPRFGIELPPAYSRQHRHLRVARYPNDRRIPDPSTNWMLKQHRERLRSPRWDMPRAEQDVGCENCSCWRRNFWVTAKLELRCCACNVIQKTLVIQRIAPDPKAALYDEPAPLKEAP